MMFGRVVVGSFYTQTMTQPSHRFLLGLHSSAWPYMQSLSEAQAAKLVYRDHINMKHADRKRLATEIETKSQQLELQPKIAVGGLQLEDGGDSKDADCMTKMLLKYLVEVQGLVKM